jgi:hypothetical protein
MESWADYCLDCAERRRRYALAKFRMARLFKDHQMLSDGKALMRDAIAWLRAARRK